MLMGTYDDICIVSLPNAECDFEEDDVDASEAMIDTLVFRPLPSYSSE